MKPELISVIIPVYNAEKYIGDCLESVLAQTYPHFEVICIDDGSTDIGGRILEEYTKRDMRVRVYHQENKGLPETRNIGVSQARGQYICFVDADDRLHPQFLEMMRKAAVISHADIVGCDFMKIADEDRFNGYEKQTFQKLRICDEALRYKRHHCHFMVCGKLYQQHVLKRVNFHPEIQYGEDVLHSWQTYAVISKIAYLTNQLYLWRQSTVSMTRCPMNERLIEDHIRMYTILTDFFLKRDIKKSLYRSIQRKLNKRLLDTLIRYPYEKGDDQVVDWWKKHWSILEGLIVQKQFNPAMLSWRYRMLLLIWRRRWFRVVPLFFPSYFLSRRSKATPTSNVF